MNSLWHLIEKTQLNIVQLNAEIKINRHNFKFLNKICKKLEEN